MKIIRKGKLPRSNVFSNDPLPGPTVYHGLCLCCGSIVQVDANETLNDTDDKVYIVCPTTYCFSTITLKPGPFKKGKSRK